MSPAPRIPRSTIRAGQRSTFRTPGTSSTARMAAATTTAASAGTASTTRCRAPSAGRKFFLQFDGANTITDVWVNGTYLGQHRGGYARFRFDATAALKVGPDNVIAVKVNNARQPDIPPLAGDFTFFGGLYRGVHLLVTDRSRSSARLRRPGCVSETDQCQRGVGRSAGHHQGLERQYHREECHDHRCGRRRRQHDCQDPDSYVADHRGGRRTRSRATHHNRQPAPVEWPQRPLPVPGLCRDPRRQRGDRPGRPAARLSLLQRRCQERASS